MSTWQMNKEKEKAKTPTNDESKAGELLNTAQSLEEHVECSRKDEDSDEDVLKVVA